MRRKLELFPVLAFVGTGYVTYSMVMESQKFDTLYDFGEYLYGRGYNETEKGWKIVSPWVAHNVNEFLIWSGYKKRDTIKEVKDGVDLNAIKTTVLPPITLPTPTTTTTNAPGMRTCAQCTGGNYNDHRELMTGPIQYKLTTWREDWIETDCLQAKGTFQYCEGRCVFVTVSRHLQDQQTYQVEGVLSDCADDLFRWGTDLPFFMRDKTSDISFQTIAEELFAVSKTI
ncbi:hypothetical protein L5515_017896 [Caenorhabditis briggsae]|uniref:Uncharacterized protein n=1 Tax=Caenorhabditis briggsae TaxID=6238 RepID=A0AAE9FFJ7_CAEBR|nr:hypothetical protein L5515_017896 [Caenorhabditis briggsae]